MGGGVGREARDPHMNAGGKGKTRRPTYEEGGVGERGGFYLGWEGRGRASGGPATHMDTGENPTCCGRAGDPHTVMTLYDTGGSSNGTYSTHPHMFPVRPQNSWLGRTVHEMLSQTDHRIGRPRQLYTVCCPTQV